MNNRERALAILRYEKYDRMPAVHFGYWGNLVDSLIINKVIDFCALQ